jgi:hypothetical protein
MPVAVQNRLPTIDITLGSQTSLDSKEVKLNVMFDICVGLSTRYKPYRN